LLQKLKRSDSEGKQSIVPHAAIQVGAAFHLDNGIFDNFAQWHFDY